MSKSTTESQEPKTRFKIGDRVRVLNICSGATLRVGDEITVGYTSDGLVGRTYEDSMFEYRFELVEEKPVGVDLSRPVTTRDGRKVRILCTDRKGSEHPIVGLVDTKDCEELYHWTPSGVYNRFGHTCGLDLINPPVKKYINLFKNDVGRMYYATREDAEKAGKASNKANPGVGYIKTIEVEL